MQQWVLVGLLLWAGIASLSSQESIDTSRLDEGITYEKRNSFTSIFYGQPGKAALYSLAIPGAGQLYNKRWWKAPLIWAGEGYLVYNLINSISEANQWQECREGLLQGSIGVICPQVLDGQGQLMDISTPAQAFEFEESAKAAKERAWLFFIAGHLIQTLEAFVDRHLINFNTSDHLSVRFTHDTHQGSLVIASPQIRIISVSVNLNHIGQ